MSKESSTLMQTLTKALRPSLAHKQDVAHFHSGISLQAGEIDVIPGPSEFRAVLHERLAQARKRITLVALYLQDDTAGREVLEALHQAKRANPALEIQVLVDWHRARRSRIGEESTRCNADLYRELTTLHGEGVPVYGVPVQTREIFGVMHLKGFIIDDAVLYSGASLNDVYLARHGRYRLDRYHLIRSATLADVMDAYVKEHLLDNKAVLRLDLADQPRSRHRQSDIRHLRASLRKAHYQLPVPLESTGPLAAPADLHTSLSILPLVGLGARHNQLNSCLSDLTASAKERLVIFTPYFNFPREIRLNIGKRLKEDVEVQIILGNKEANDFFIPPSEPFNTIGLLPYLYEANLRRFARKYQKEIDAGKLHLHLWSHENHTFHLKGMFVDDHTSVLTGNNLNPRAWSLDLENALLIHDPNHTLREQNQAELTRILAHAPRLAHYKQLQNPKDYPEKVQRLMKRLSSIRVDRIVNKIL